MQNKKISTTTGVIVLLAIIGALSVSFLVSNKKENMQNPETIRQEKTTENNEWKTFTDNEYGYAIDYPSNWNVTQRTPSEHNIDFVFVFATSGPNIDESNGTIGFGKYSIYNKSLTDSVEENLKFLNSKINITGENSTFIEVPIEGGRAFYNPLKTSPSSREREIFIIGKNIIFNGTFQTSSDDINAKEMARFTDILSHFKFLQ